MSGIDEAPLTSPRARNRGVLDLFFVEQFYGEWYHNAGIIIFVCHTSFLLGFTQTVYSNRRSSPGVDEVILRVISSTPHPSASHWASARMYLGISEGFGHGIPFNIHCLWHA